MTQQNRVNLDKFMEEFTLLEQKIAELHGKNNDLELTMGDISRQTKYHQTRERNMNEERDSLLATVNSLQQTVQEQCSLRAENEKLKSDLADSKDQNKRVAEARAEADGAAEIQRLLNEMKVEEERHMRELETVRQKWQQKVEEAHKEGLDQVHAKDAEIQKVVEQKDQELEDLRKRLKDLEKERQSEILKLKMEFGSKLARIQNAADGSLQQQKQHDSNVMAQSFFKRKMQFFQEEKNKEIASLRQRIRELEENQPAGLLSDRRLKRRKI